MRPPSGSIEPSMRWVALVPPTPLLQPIVEGMLLPAVPGIAHILCFHRLPKTLWHPSAMRPACPSPHPVRLLVVHPLLRTHRRKWVWSRLLAMYPRCKQQQQQTAASQSCAATNHAY
jgi:hypothetical protein